MTGPHIATSAPHTGGDTPHGAHAEGTQEHHLLTDSTCLWVWLGLCILTAITVGVAQIDLRTGLMHVLVAMIVATAKAALVILWFMHMKYESKAIRLMVFMAFLILAICISFTFFDVAYR